MRMCAGKLTQRLKMEEEISSSATPSPERRLRPRQQRRVEMSDTSSTSSPVRRGAVRGRGRGRPAGRRGARGGRGGGRGQRGGHIGDVAALQDRQRNLRARIEEMSDTSRKELLMKTGDKHPSLLLDLIDQEAPQGGFHPVPGGESPNWCSCLMCRDMPTQIERICCGRPPNQCQSQLPDFQLLILDELVLTIAQMYRQDVLDLPQDEDYNKGKRYAAYRQFILWHHGRLGVGVRRIIPSCCTWAIRDKYPNQYGQYIGFIPSRLG